MAGTTDTRPRQRSLVRAISTPWVVSVAVLAILVICAVRFPGSPHTLQPYTDHVRHEYAAWAFLKIGTRIWTDPLGDWNASGRFVHDLWSTVPHVHPPGSVMLFLPFGAATNLGVIPDEAVHVLMVVLFGAAAIAAAVALWRTLRPAYPPALAGVATALGGIELLRWGLNGFFDPLAVLVALGGILLLQRGRPGPAALVLALSLSLHYRLWYLVPVAVAAAIAHRRFDLRSGIASAVLGLSALPLIPLGSFLADLPVTAGFSPNPLYGELAVAIVAAALMVLLAVSERRVVPVLATAAASVMILFNPQWQPWYAIAFLPLLPLVRTIPAQAALTVGWVQLALLSPQALELPALFRWLGEGLGI